LGVWACGWAQTPTNIIKMEVNKMNNMFNFMVYRDLSLLGVMIVVAGFRDKESAEDYVNFIKIKNPHDDYCIKEVKEVERLRDS
jgi:hypothetical protein